MKNKIIDKGKGKEKEIKKEKEKEKEEIHDDKEAWRKEEKREG